MPSRSKRVERPQSCVNPVHDRSARLCATSGSRIEVHRIPVAGKVGEALLITLSKASFAEPHGHLS